MVIAKPEMDSADDGSSYPAGGGRLAKMIEVPRAAMSPWEAAAQYGGRLDPAFQHIDAYRAAASHITFDDFVDDEEEDSRNLVTSAEPFTQPQQSHMTSVSDVRCILCPQQTSVVVDPLD